MSTYRLQLRREFGFDEVVRIVPYLHRLGVSHVYLSPHLQAVEGSAHGYDVVDHSRVSSELGGPEAHARMIRALQSAEIGVIVDIVPNHMAIPGRENGWWWDVLKYGSASRYANYFDIDWSAVAENNDDRVLLPVLGARYGDVLANGELELQMRPDGPVVAYYDSEFPIRDLKDEEVGELSAINADRDHLHEILERQLYRLAYWPLAADELDYRRFFDVSSLMALRSERPDVFEAVHALPARWVKEGVIDGLRIDHIDGLANPAEYLQRIRALLGSDGYLAVEKILEPGERLRASWPVQGTTGYEALRLVDGLFVDSVNEDAFDKFFKSFTDYELNWDATVRECKSLVVDRLFGSDVDRLRDALHQICQRYPEARDFVRRDMRRVIKALLVSLDVYRTYVVPETGYISEDDESIVANALIGAKADLEEELQPLAEFVAGILTLRRDGTLEHEFVRRFQQMSGPVMAKGVEDTAGYRFNRFVMLNEVGGASDRFGVRPDEFHENAAEISKAWPARLVAGTTHDTKRSEDVRYRLALLSEMPDEWREAVTEWSAINETHRRSGPGGEQWPDRNTEYLLYQTLVGAYPLDVERATTYILKAARESRSITSWQETNEAYEEALTRFVAAACVDAQFQTSLVNFVEPLVPLGRIVSLAAVVLRMTMAGVPDLFQGSEFWNLSLVDPDNRQPVDYDERVDALKTVREGETPDIANDDLGLSKLFVLNRLLELRCKMPRSFGPGADYQPVVCAGKRAANVVAFVRDDVAVVVPRLIWSLGGDWMDTSIDLPQGDWKNIFTNERFGGRVGLTRLFERFPVVVLIKGASNG